MRVMNMKLRLVIAAPDADSIDLYRSLLESALDLLPLDIEARYVTSRAELTREVAAHEADAMLLDWLLAGPETPAYARELIALDPRLRTIIVMPLHLRQYRACVWDAGACVGVPKEHLDQEWLLSMLCLMNRAMEREMARGG
jgi:DNA-binding NarL/FixJ family response regulator